MTAATVVTTAPALSVRGLSASLGSFALRDVSFDLPTGFVMGFVGPNGSGKTTTIRCLLGMLIPDSGQIDVLGHRMPAPSEIRQDIGVVLDRTCYVEDWRLDDVERALRPFYPCWDRAEYRRLLDHFGLDRALRVKDLSRGMAMKLTIAVALSHQARLLVLDEPTSGLDPVARDDLVGILGDFLADADHSVLFSTHITADLERIADYVTFIHSGRIVSSGTKDDLLDEFRLVRGGPDDLPDPLQVTLIGTRRHDSGFEALVRTEQVDLLGHGLAVEAPSLDQIVVHFGAETRS